MSFKSIDPFSLYQKAFQKAYELFNVEPALQKIINERVQKVANEAFSIVDSDLAPRDNNLAPQIAAHLSIPEETRAFQVILKAANDFEIFLKSAKESEARMFSVLPPPPPQLTPVKGPKGAVPYTLLQYSVRSADQLVKLAKTFGVRGIRHLVPLNPERLVLHEMCKNVVVGHQIPSELGSFDKQIAKLIPGLAKKFLKKNPGFEKEANHLRITAESQALQLLSGGKVKGELVSPDFPEILEHLKKQVQKTAGLSESEINHAVAQKAADHITESFVRNQVDRFDLDSDPLMKHYPPLPTQTKSTRRVFMINGGVASGKGTTEKEMIKQVSSEGINWDHVLRLNNDSFKGMLLNPAELEDSFKPFYSGLTHDEASLIRHSTFMTYQQMLDSNTAPHLFVDQVWPNDDIIEMGASLDKGIDVMVVQIPVQNSFRMAYRRGEETGRFENTAEILRTHSQVPSVLDQSLDIVIKQKKQLNVRLQLFANVAKGKVQPMAEIDFSKGSGVIQDMTRLLKFYQKTKLNTAAKTFGELYSDASLDIVEVWPFITHLISYCPNGLRIKLREA